MKNIRIAISHEYEYNLPSIFAIIDGKYYGCMIYPRGTNFPSVEYWTDATSSDSHRGFAIIDSNISDEMFSHIENLQSIISENEKMIVRKSYPYISSKEKGWKEKTNLQNIEMKMESERNAPFEKLYYPAFSSLRKVLKNISEKVEA